MIQLGYSRLNREEMPTSKVGGSLFFTAAFILWWKSLVLFLKIHFHEMGLSSQCLSPPTSHLEPGLPVLYGDRQNFHSSAKLSEKSLGRPSTATISASFRTAEITAAICRSMISFHAQCARPPPGCRLEGSMATRPSAHWAIPTKISSASSQQMPKCA